jgi:hypothetical protein
MTLDLKVKPTDHGSNPEGVEPYAQVPEECLAVTATPRQRSCRETEDAYPCLARLDHKRRVIECADAIQWMRHRNGGRWRNGSFHRNRDALIRCSGATGEALAILQALPEMHP